MTDSARHDAWQAGDSYDFYMGRWSRQIAPLFVEWLNPGRRLDWLDIGCGTGALTGEIVRRCDPVSITSIDPSPGFVERARSNVADERVSFAVGDAQALDAATGSLDMVVSALVLNFIPDRHRALAEMARVVRPGGTVAFYVWDYPAGGVGFMRAFWQAAAALDPKAADLAEDRRFPFCTRDGLVGMAQAAGLAGIGATRIDVPTLFRDFDDFWRPFTLGAGPAPGYCASLEPRARDRLEARLRDDLPAAADGSIPLTAAAWAVRGMAG